MKHNEFIAQMRGLAIAVVVIMHYAMCFTMGYAQLPAIGNGYYGVSLFFALSGFLITTNMIARYGALGRVDLRAFYVMRAARILPCLGLVVVILTIVSLTAKLPGFAFARGLSPGEAVISLLTLQFNNYYLRGASGTLAWGVLWSISIEEAFYFAYPIVVIVLRNELRIAALLIGIAVYGPFARDNFYGLYYFFGCFDQLAMGALAAMAAQRLGKATPPSWIPFVMGVGAALTLGTYLALPPGEHFTIGPSLIGLGGSLMLFASALRRSDRKSTILGRIGSYSYELYLFHMAVFALAANLIPVMTGVTSYVIWAVLLLVAYQISAAIAVYFSQPLNAYFRKSAEESSIDRVGLNTATISAVSVSK